MLTLDELMGPERELLGAIATGRPVNLQTGNPVHDDPASGASWGEERQIRAQVLFELLAGASGPDAARVRGLKVLGARITGALDLEGVSVRCPVVLRGCSFEEPINLQEAQVPVLRLSGCHLPGLNAKQLETRGDLELNHGFTARGEIDLCGAQIGGDLVLAGATLNHPGGVALRGSGLTVKQSMFCGDGFAADGEVRLLGAHIGGSLTFNGATLLNPDRHALNASRASIDQALFCGHSLDLQGGFSVQGEVRLVSAHVGSFASFRGAALSNPGERALTASGLTVAQGMHCTDGFTAQGEVNLLGAHIGGSLSFSSATLTNPTPTNPNQYALNAARLVVGQAMFLGRSLDDPEGATVTGQVRLVDAQIHGFLTFKGTSLANPGGVALAADRLTVDHDIYFDNGFTADGEIRLVDGRVKSLICSGGAFANPDGVALNADGLTATRDVQCTDGFTADGEVRLRGARIGEQLTFDGATLGGTGRDRVALALQHLNAQVLVLRPQTPPPGHVDLTHAHVRALVDSKAVWPHSLGLVDFVYDVLHEDPKVSVADRLTWLERDPRGYAPQPYQQLVAVYRKAGRDEDARHVAIAKQRRRRKSLHLPGRLWGLLLDGAVGYGYRTWQAGLWLLALVAVGAAIFASAYPQQMPLAKNPGDPRPTFQPWIYSLDVLLPVVNLHQEEFWIPQAVARWWAWLSILAGWLLTTVVIAAVSGLLKKD